MSRRRSALIGVTCAFALACTGCGLNVQSADLFLLTRTGPGQTLKMLVNDSGTIRCNGHAAKPLPGPLLLQARDLVNSLDNDAKAGLRISPSPGSVYRYKVELQDGTISFPDRAATRHPALAQVELFAVQAAGACGLGTT